MDPRAVVSFFGGFQDGFGSEYGEVGFLDVERHIERDGARALSFDIRRGVRCGRLRCDTAEVEELLIDAHSDQRGRLRAPGARTRRARRANPRNVHDPWRQIRARRIVRRGREDLSRCADRRIPLRSWNLRLRRLRLDSGDGCPNRWLVRAGIGNRFGQTHRVAGSGDAREQSGRICRGLLCARQRGQRRECRE